MARRHLVDDWVDDPWDDPTGSAPWTFEPARRRGSALRFVVAFAVVVFLGLAAVGGGLAMWVARQLNPPGDPGERVVITVEEGDTVDGIATRLKELGVISNESVFRWYADYSGGVDLQPGEYTVRERAEMADVIDVLNTPPEQTFSKVTFPEGFTLSQMGLRLADRIPRLTARRFTEVVEGGQLRSSLQPEGATDLQGLLFPDTYQIAGTENEASVARRLIRQMERVAEQEKVFEAAERLLRPGFRPYDVLIVASMIEREAKVPEDRPKIARVIYNRLNAGMPLQIDATVFYAAGGSQETFSEALELAAGSPWNTYEVVGLPPTPITNPGRASIQAAMNPTADEDWLYYVLADEEGRHVFATDYDEHLRNVAEARRRGLLG